MYSFPDFLLHGIIIGAGATLILDLWALLARRAYDAVPTNWAMAGRWFAYLRHGQFRHESIAEALPVHGELAIGWIGHYLVGIIYGLLVVASWAILGVPYPTWTPPLVIGMVVASCAAFFLMQPGMGMGVAASKTPDPARVRLRTLINHLVFSAGLYIVAVLCAAYLG